MCGRNGHGVQRQWQSNTEGESSRDQEEDVKPERGKGSGGRDTRMCGKERERPEVAGTGRQGGEKGQRKQGGQGRGGRGVRQGRGEKRKQRKGERTGRKGERGRVETDTEANVSPNMGTLKTNLRYSGNWGHWNLQRKQTKITVGREQSTVTLCWSPGSAGAVCERQEEGTQMGQ